MTGTIIRIIHARGYGFVRDDCGSERFIHALDLSDSAVFLSLREGQRISFEPHQRQEPRGKNNGLGMKDVKPL